MARRKKQENEAPKVDAEEPEETLEAPLEAAKALPPWAEKAERREAAAEKAAAEKAERKEAAISLLSDNRGEIRGQIKEALRPMGPGAGVAVLKALASYTKDAPDQMAAGKIRESLAKTLGHIEGLEVAAVKAREEGAEEGDWKLYAVQASRYAAAHAASAAAQAIRAIGGPADTATNKVRSRVLAAVGGV